MRGKNFATGGGVEKITQAEWLNQNFKEAVNHIIEIHKRVKLKSGNELLLLKKESGWGIAKYNPKTKKELEWYRYADKEIANYWIDKVDVDKYSDGGSIENKNKLWYEVLQKFFKIFYGEYEDDTAEKHIKDSQVTTDQAKYYYENFMDKYKTERTLSDGFKIFKQSLTKEELDSIQISFNSEDYADAEEHDTQKRYSTITIKKKENFKKGGRIIGTYYFDSIKDKKFQVISISDLLMRIQYVSGLFKPIGDIEFVSQKEFDYNILKGTWWKVEDGYAEIKLVNGKYLICLPQWYRLEKDGILEENDTKNAKDWLPAHKSTNCKWRDMGSPYGERYMYSQTYDQLRYQNQGEWYSYGSVSDTFKKGGIVVTSIKDIPNFEQRNKENKITYRGLGLGKLFNDFYAIAGEDGTIIKVDGKEYFITDTEFNTFSRDSDGRMRIRFDAPNRNN